jgi:sugar phosphate isomerase/epimerase
VSGATVLAWVEHCLPATSTAGRLALADRLGLALEVGNRDGLDEDVLHGDVPVVTLQAWDMHTVHPTHPDKRARQAGMLHLAETIELAAAEGIPRVLAICGYGQDVCDHPFEQCRDAFDSVLPLARSRGVKVMIELLSPLRAAAMTDPFEFAGLIDALDAPDVFGTVLDTGHLLDAGADPVEVLSNWRHPVDELQLRGPGSTPPADDLELGELLDALPRPPAVVAVEYREPLDEAGVERLAARLAGELASR